MQFSDARDQRCSLVDKAPIFDAPEGLGPGSAFPLAVGIAVVVVEKATPDAGNDVTVSTSARGVIALSGDDEFTVRRDQLVP